MSKYTYTEEQLREAVKKSVSIAGVCRELGIRPVGGNYKTLKDRFTKLNIDTSHFTGKGWNVGLKFVPNKSIPLEEILVQDSNYKSTVNLKNKLFKAGLKERKCERCGNTEWLGVQIPLELHHINGVNTDNRLENLQILCPNCHAITDNYRGKNLMSALSEKREVEYRKFKETLASSVEGNLEPSLIKEGAETLHDKPKSRKKLQPKICPYCNKEFQARHNDQKYCSQECSHKGNGSRRPTVFELIEKFKELKSFVQVGNYYGVTDNAVRKWCKLYGILDMVKKKSGPQTG